MGRRRFFALALIPVGLGAYLFLVPRYGDVELAVSLGQRARRVRQLELQLLRDGLVTRDLTLAFPDGAPPEVRRAVRLRNGDYQVAVRVRWDDGRESHVGRDLRTDSPETIDLSSLR